MYLKGGAVSVPDISYLVAVSPSRSRGFVRAGDLSMFAPGFSFSGVSKGLAHLHLQGTTRTQAHTFDKQHIWRWNRLGLTLNNIPSLWMCPRSSCGNVSTRCSHLPRSWIRQSRTCGTFHPWWTSGSSPSRCQRLRTSLGTAPPSSEHNVHIFVGTEIHVQYACECTLTSGRVTYPVREILNDESRHSLWLQTHMCLMN